jgi:hypothetical protein
MYLWTVAGVQVSLPDVKICAEVFGVKHHCVGHIRGRRGNFAKVYVDGIPGSVEFAWETIVDALNEGRELNIS